jgi:DNA-binding MarR family transcriptional regulator
MSWLLQTCFKLQASLDRRFLHFGITFQEAAVLLRCVEAREIAPSRLALVLARDRGKITRFTDRLEAAQLVKRHVNTRDRRSHIIKATPKGKRLAERIAMTFHQIRKELFVGVLDRDVLRLCETLPQLHGNASRISTQRAVSGGPRARRIGGEKDGQQDNGLLEETPAPVRRSSNPTSDCQEKGDERWLNVGWASG